MSGHSKWATIKRKKGALDQERSKVFQKLNREIFVAAKKGDKDPMNNPSLRMVVDKAKALNMPKDRIQAAIDKAHASGSGEDYEAVRYEGYGPSGVAIMVDCLTDNRNRTAGDVRSTFSKRGGNLGTDGSVSYMFERKGIIALSKEYNEDEVMLVALDNGAIDFNSGVDAYEIITSPDDFFKMSEALKGAGFIKVLGQEVRYVPNNMVSLDLEKQEKIYNLIDALEELDDVCDVYHNMEE